MASRRVLTILFSRRMLPVWILLALVGLAGPFAWQRLQAHEHWRAARAALGGQDPETARRHLAACVYYWPDDPEVRFWAARAARQCEAYEEAEEHLAACERLQAASPAPGISPGFERALLRAQLGETQQLQHLVRRSPSGGDDKIPLALEAVARGDMRTMRYLDATTAVVMLREKYPEHVGGLLVQARLFRHFGRNESALECYEQALARVPEARAARLGMGESLASLGRHPEAVRLFEDLRRTAPDNADILLPLARCRADLAQVGEARALLDHLLAAHPDHAGALFERGRLEFHHGSLPKAEDFLRRAVAAAPPRAEVLAALAACLEAEGRQEEATEWRARTERWEVEHGRVAREMHRITQKPTDPAGARAIAAELMRLGEDEEALHWYAAALQQDPQAGDVHRALADYFAEHGQPHRSAYHRLPARRASEAPHDFPASRRPE